MQIMIDEARLKAVAELLKKKPPSTEPLNFYSMKTSDGKEIVLSDMYPAIGHPRTLDYFFLGVLQDYGFWLDHHDGYKSPFYATLTTHGKPHKGSDALWKCLKKAFDRDPDAFTPERLAEMKIEDFSELFASELGPVAFPRMEERFKLARKYAQFLLYWHTSPEIIVEDAECVRINLKDASALYFFLEHMKAIPGFGQDPLMKKAQLLAMALANRPEKFLDISPRDTNWKPMLDYHLMRVALRLGIVVVDGGAEFWLWKRKWVKPEIEAEIREMCFTAIRRIRELSGVTNDKIDIVFWMARKYCPEMTEPECGKCHFEPVCGKHTELFQPVGLPRTNYY